jgi:hypothetical protein
MTDGQTPAPWIAGAAVLMLLLGGYVGLYLFSVDAVRRPPAVPGHGVMIVPAKIFAPIHWLDRRIRPHVWEPTP